MHVLMLPMSALLAASIIAGCSSQSLTGGGVFRATQAGSPRNGADQSKGGTDAGKDKDADGDDKNDAGSGTDQGNEGGGEGNDGGDGKDGDSDSGGADSGGTEGDGIDGGDSGSSDGLYEEEGIVKVPFADASQAVMFRGTLGINLREATVGKLLNGSDKQILDDSGGHFVATGLRTGAGYNDWGLYVKAATPIAAVKGGYVERAKKCDDGEIVVGLPDRGVDATQSNPSATPGWQNRFICAKLTSKYKVKEVTSISYSHSYNLSVDCPGKSLMAGYDCGTCGVPNPSTLTCVQIELE